MLKDGVLTVTGSGKLWDCRWGESPWKDADVRTAVIGEGITSVGRYLFAECGLTEVQFPSTLKEIGEGAFSQCRKLYMADIPAGVERIGYGAFSGCDCLTSLYFLGDVPAEIGDWFLNRYGAVIQFRSDIETAWTEPEWTAPDGTVYQTRAVDPAALPSLLFISPAAVCEDIFVSVDLYRGDEEIYTGYFSRGESLCIPDLSRGTYTLKAYGIDRRPFEQEVRIDERVEKAVIALYPYGDVTEDGEFTAMDLQRAYRQQEEGTGDPGAVDVDHDGKFTADDLLKLFRALLRYVYLQYS